MGLWREEYVHSMIGHQKNLDDLKQLAASGALGHGYIFFGPAMVGKKLAARSFAEYLESGVMLRDASVIEPGENNSIGIDAAREARNFLWQKPNVSERRTLIINDAELMTTEAQNALLKLTEEPPASSLLILITADLESILPTILSRLPKIYFGTVAQGEIEAWLTNSEGVKVGAQAKSIAAKSLGKPGLALRLIHDKAFQEQLELAEKLLKTPAAARRDLVKKIIDPDEFNFRKFLDAVIINLAWRGAEKKNAVLWHKALALYDRETNFSLNPRLQIEALLG